MLAAARPMLAAAAHLAHRVDMVRAGRRSRLGSALLLPPAAALIVLPLLLLLLPRRAMRGVMRDAVPAVRRLICHAGPSMAAARRSETPAERARLALATVLASHLRDAAALTHRVAATMRASLGATLDTIQPRIATAMVAGQPRTSAA